MRRVIINEEQAKLYRAMDAPILGVLKSVGEEGSVYFPLHNMQFAEKLIAQGYADAVSCFNDDITAVPTERVVNQFNKLLSICIRKEEKIRNELEKICFNLIVEAFDIPEDTITFELNLYPEIEGTHNFHITPTTNDDERVFDSVDDINIETKEVEKRKLVNMLTQGVTDEINNQLLRKATSDLFDLDEELPHLYSKLVKLNNYLLFNRDVKIKDKNHHQGGYVETLIGNDLRPTMIKVAALTFPFLLSEAIKGVIESITANGLPDSPDTAKIIIDKSDCLEQEPWNMRMGYWFWKKLLSDNELDSKLVPYFIDYIVKSDADSFIGFIDEIIHNTNKGKKIVTNIANAVKHDADYKKFSSDLLKKDQEKPLITDEFDY